VQLLDTVDEEAEGAVEEVQPSRLRYQGDNDN
jgi:hypothetical protein